MRCHYLSDLHLESQALQHQLPKGDVLIVAGDLCHARCLDPSRTDKYSVDQRGRVMRFLDMARSNYRHILLIAGNHEHYDGVFEDTIGLLRSHLPGVVVLDNEAVEIGSVRFFGTTLWSDFEGRTTSCLNGVRRRMGEFFFVKTRKPDSAGNATLAKFLPEDALHAHDIAWAAMLSEVSAPNRKPTVVISHHAPSSLGLNPLHAGNGLDGAYASNLDDAITKFENVPIWVHGHTHIRRTYTIGRTRVLANCRGFEGKDLSARSFNASAYFEV